MADIALAFTYDGIASYIPMRKMRHIVTKKRQYGAFGVLFCYLMTISFPAHKSEEEVVGGREFRVGVFLMIRHIIDGVDFEFCS